MFECSLLLYDPEEHVTGVVRDIVSGLKECQCQSVLSMEEAPERCCGASDALLVAYLASPDDLAAAIKLLDRVITARIPMPVIFIQETDDAAVRLQLIRKGAVECLSWPLNVSRLAMLISLLMVRPRQAAKNAELSGKTEECDRFLPRPLPSRHWIGRLRLGR